MPGLELDAVDTNRAGILPEMGHPDILGDLSGSEPEGVVYDRYHLAPCIGSPPHRCRAAFKPTMPTPRAVFPCWTPAQLCNSLFLTYAHAHLPWAWPQFCAACHLCICSSIHPAGVHLAPTVCGCGPGKGNLEAPVQNQRSQM